MSRNQESLLYLHKSRWVRPGACFPNDELKCALIRHAALGSKNAVEVIGGESRQGPCVQRFARVAQAKVKGGRVDETHARYRAGPVVSFGDIGRRRNRCTA